MKSLESASLYCSHLIVIGTTPEAKIIFTNSSKSSEVWEVLNPKFSQEILTGCIYQIQDIFLYMESTRNKSHEEKKYVKKSKVDE